ncbi:MAG: vitamin K epoxide reductase family protein, partial [Chloroflexota bacterium]
LYLAYVDTTTTEAVCGVIGACNVVQSSEYASILGVPTGVIGVVGYSLILALSLAGQRSPRALWAAFGLTIGGVVFSIYLTYLEPFVIKATCVWCLMSAVVMALLLWMLASALLTSQPTRQVART